MYIDVKTNVLQKIMSMMYFFKWKKKYENNVFPIGLIKDKNILLVQRDFKPAENKEERQKRTLK